MARPKKTSKANPHHVTPSGIVVDAKVVTGTKNKLDAKQQGQLARGEIDEAGEATDKEAQSPDGVRTIKTGETLYQGDLSAEATAAATGEKVSMKWHQSSPTTEDGCFNSFLAYHPSAIRETFKLDPSNKIDPTLRTSLEIEGVRPKVGDKVDLKVTGTIQKLVDETAFVTPETINDQPLAPKAQATESEDLMAAAQSIDAAGGGY